MRFECLVGVGELAIVIAAWLSMWMVIGESDCFGERWKGIAGECVGRRGIHHSLASWRSNLRARAAREASMNSASALDMAWASWRMKRQKMRSAANENATPVLEYFVSRYETKSELDHSERCKGEACSCFCEFLRAY
eukprot:Plantae.Rhodophyta-Palmaria_palmata.ctg2768.p2 GENE.Plantae.Rhodophyta-Palmaria_palmata.ctg2768~~Plantae.Rhodophyta-Palmaria_palmata.ctg2768.p2  ORF type:complete len:137 (+),score=13.33 Plantae.Rhodophyta-Palmaria_palmata.ctg2768:157-567(+)